MESGLGWYSESEQLTGRQVPRPIEIGLAGAIKKLGKSVKTTLSWTQHGSIDVAVQTDKTSTKIWFLIRCIPADKLFSSLPVNHSIFTLDNPDQALWAGMKPGCSFDLSKFSPVIDPDFFEGSFPVIDHLAVGVQTSVFFDSGTGKGAPMSKGLGSSFTSFEVKGVWKSELDSKFEVRPSLNLGHTWVDYDTNLKSEELVLTVYPGVLKSGPAQPKQFTIASPPLSLDVGAASVLNSNQQPDVTDEYVLRAKAALDSSWGLYGLPDWGKQTLNGSIRYYRIGQGYSPVSMNRLIDGEVFVSYVWPLYSLQEVDLHLVGG